MRIEFVGENLTEQHHASSYSRSKILASCNVVRTFDLGAFAWLVAKAQVSNGLNVMSLRKHVEGREAGDFVATGNKFF